MLRMRRITDQGFVVLTHFVRAGEGAVLTARAVAEELGLPAPTTAKVLKTLQRAGLLDSTRGLCGGYSLACDPETTALPRVIAAFEGPLGLTDCAIADHISCESHDTCSLGAAWPSINDAVLGVLSTITLADLVRGGAQGRPAASDLPVEPAHGPRAAHG